MLFNEWGEPEDDGEASCVAEDGAEATVISMASTRDGHRPADQDTWPVQAKAGSDDVPVLHTSVLTALGHLDRDRDGRLPTTTIELFRGRSTWTELPEAHPTVAGVLLDAVREDVVPVGSLLRAA
jgi:hypothetical protein